MANVLVVDAEREFRESIARHLIEDGHQVDVASDAGDALRRACLNKPDVLVTEWMLGGTFDGLDMSELVETVNPRAQTIMFTGFASNDLRQQSSKSGVFEFLEKPLPITALRSVVQKAVYASTQESSQSENSRLSDIGVMYVSLEGSIDFFNTAMLRMVQDLSGSGHEQRISQLFSVYELAVLNSARDEWVRVSPFESSKEWYVRVREMPELGTELWVVLDAEHAYWRDSLPVSRLLGLPEPKPQADGHFLIIDDLESFRTVTQRLLKGLNTICHTANTHAEAIRLFVRDTDIRYVVLDYRMPDGEAADLIAKLQELRPGVSIVGTSGDPQYRNSFAQLGVRGFLNKPWTATELFQLLELPLLTSSRQPRTASKKH